MEAQADTLRLGAEFPAASREQWLALVEGVLKGASFDKRLVSRTRDGLTIQPLYPRAADARAIAGRAPGRPWQVMQRIDLPDAAEANAEALHELQNGASGLTLAFSGAVGAYGFGLEASEAALARVLDGVHLDAGIAVECDLGADLQETARIVAALVKRHGVSPAATAIRWGLDPLGAMAASGEAEADWPALAPAFAAGVRALAEAGFAGPFAAADGRIVHAAGGSEAQELGFSLATAVAYLRALEAEGLALDSARRMIFFRLAADADQFMGIAKFRALRKLWSRVEAACGLAPAPTFVSAETAWRMMTARDPWVNMLRTTMAAFAAGLGGADAVTVLPFTAAIGLPDRFARRVARNSQLVLIEESNLARVADPAAGSGGFEDLTRQLCEASWALFQEIERAGGAAAALQSGLVQQKIAAVREQRAAAIARRNEAITGTSEFPHLAEAPVSVLARSPRKAGAHPRAIQQNGAGLRVQPLPALRLAEPFEALRDAADAILERSGARPKVFLATLGTPADFTARAMFAKNLFEAGGIEATSSDGYTDRAGMVAAFKSSGARLACLCSSDDIYAREAEDAAKSLAGAGVTPIYLAGRPGEAEASLRAAGVQGFIHAGCDALKTLVEAHDRIAAGAPAGR